MFWATISKPIINCSQQLGFSQIPSHTDFYDDLDGKIAIITGANTGVGKQTATHLAAMGAHVILACRSMEKGEIAAKEILQKIKATQSDSSSSSKMSVKAMQLDLSDLDSVRAFSAEFCAAHPRLDILVNNAGTNDKAGPPTKQGHGHCFGINFLGPFLLTNLLLEKMKQTEAATRIVNLSSVMHHFAEGDFEQSIKPTFYKDSYRDSKLAMLLFTLALNRHLRDTRVTAVAVNPGAVNSDIWRHAKQKRQGIKGAILTRLEQFLYLNSEQGAATSVYGAVGNLSRACTTHGYYLAPYMVPSFLGGLRVAFEMLGPFAGPKFVIPSLPENEKQKSEALWKLCEQLTGQ